MSGSRAIAIAVSCIASSTDIFPVRFDQITEPFFSHGMCHEIATSYCHKRPGMGILLILFLKNGGDRDGGHVVHWSL